MEAVPKWTFALSRKKVVARFVWDVFQSQVTQNVTKILNFCVCPTWRTFLCTFCCVEMLRRTILFAPHEQKIVWPSDDHFHHGNFEAKCATIKQLLTLMGWFRCRQIQHCKRNHKNAFDCWRRRLQSSERPNLGSVLLCCIELHQLMSHKHNSFSCRCLFSSLLLVPLARNTIFAQKSGSRLLQRTAIVSHSFHFFPGPLLSSFRICRLLFNAFALFGAHSSACANDAAPWIFALLSILPEKKNIAKGISVKC